METVVSGIRPTGNLHLGNYFGAVKSFLQMQNEYNCFFFIADWHSLTTRPRPEDIIKSSRTILAEYLAWVSTRKKRLYMCKVTWRRYLNYIFTSTWMLTWVRWKGVPRSKRKQGKQPDNVNAGLLTYPTLMAADILIHKAVKVPVGKDQEQNMEMAQICPPLQHHVWKELFPEPQSFSLASQAVKIPGSRRFR